MRKDFIDYLSFDATAKTAVSVRDGVLEYRGYELGLEPLDKVFKVYRSPATIANAANLMAGLPLTDDHVDLNSEPTNNVGRVESSKMVDIFDPSLQSTVGVQNVIHVADEMLAALEAGKRELSLGYRAELVAHESYDFEQRDIIPHHLAVVDRGRCGPHCSFIDHRKEPQMHKAFCDAEGNLNLEEVVQIASSLPDAIKKLSMEQLAKVLPVLQEIVQTAQVSGQTADIQAQAGADDHGGGDVEKVGIADSADSAEFADALERAVQSRTASFKDEMAAAIQRHTEVIAKAKDFVDASYSYVGKSTEQIQRDALAVEHVGTHFSDSELDVAFKLLKKTAPSLQNFGDSVEDKLSQLRNKEL